MQLALSLRLALSGGGSDGGGPACRVGGVRPSISLTLLLWQTTPRRCALHPGVLPATLLPCPAMLR